MRGTEFLGLFKYLILFLSASILFAQEFPDEKIDRILKNGISDILNQKYDEAELSFKHLAKEYPANPLGLVYQAAVEIAKSVDYGEKFNSSKITGLLIAAEKLSDSLNSNNPDDKWNMYYAALISGYNAYYYALSENYLVAFSEGFSSINKFQDLLENDKKFYEAYTAIGTYRYWKSRKTDILNVLPFFEDDTGEAIKLIKAAAENQNYSRHLALNSLIWIYIDKKQFKDAVKIARDELKSFPESRFFKWGLARALEDINKDEAVLVYQEILNSHLGRKNSNSYNEIVLRHKIAMLLHDSGKNVQAMEYCREIFKTKVTSEFVKSALEDRMERVKELWEELLSSQ